MEIGILPNAAMLLLLSRVLFLVVTMAYYYHLGRKPKKIWADCVTRQGRVQPSTEHKRGVRRCEIFFDWGLEHHQWMHPAPVHRTQPIVTPSFLQKSTVSHSRLFSNNEKSHAKSELLFDWAVRSSPSWHIFLICSVPSAVIIKKELAVHSVSCSPVT